MCVCGKPHRKHTHEQVIRIEPYKAANMTGGALSLINNKYQII